MKRASQIINDIQNNKADSLFLDIYQDESMIEFQKKRYVDAIEQYINLYKDEEVEIFSVPGRSEVCGNHTDPSTWSSFSNSNKFRHYYSSIKG